MAFITQRSYHRLVAEISVMSMGLTSVPIFKGYGRKMKSELLKFADSKVLIVDRESELDDIEGRVVPERIIALDQRHLIGKIECQASSLKARMLQIAPDQTAVILYTSGTSGFPKGVMLTHKNILAQQKANDVLWNLEEGMRFLSYLPWDHVFGALFERFFALSNGGCLCLDDSGGKDIDGLLKNFHEIKPHVFFSVPLVYAKLAERISSSAETSIKFHHPELKFLFTAAAPLPAAISAVFQAMGIPIVEGWGLTEASPSCTLTKPSLDRTPGYVGFPIPGVAIRLGLGDEILVQGHNVMKGYFKSDEATSKVIDKEGWLHTGDMGEIGPEGLRIVGRKDRVFKLSNGFKISPQLLEDRIQNLCRDVRHVYVFGHGMKAPYALIFPEIANISPREWERRIHFFSSGLREANSLAEAKYERIEKALVIFASPTLEDGELTPSMKLKFRTVEERYKRYIDFLTSGGESLQGTMKIVAY